MDRSTHRAAIVLPDKTEMHSRLLERLRLGTEFVTPIQTTVHLTVHRRSAVYNWLSPK